MRELPSTQRGTFLKRGGTWGQGALGAFPGRGTRGQYIDLSQVTPTTAHSGEERRRQSWD